MHILLADHNREFRKAAGRFLMGDRRVRTVSLAETVQEASASADHTVPDLLLLDISLVRNAGRKGADAIGGGMKPDTVWLLVPGKNPEYERAARSAGAAGCIPKPDFVETIDPILHELHHRLSGDGRRSGFSEGPVKRGAVTAFPGRERVGLRGIPSRGGLRESVTEKGTGERTILEAVQSLERQCLRLREEIFEIQERVAGKESDPAPTPSTAEKTDHYILCRVGGESMALPLRRLVQVREMGPLGTLPGEYAPVSGFLALEGQAVPVVDFKRLWNGPGTLPEGTGWMVLLRSRSGLIGLRVDEVGEVIPVPEASVLLFPLHPVSRSGPVLDRILSYQGRAVLVPDVDALLSDLAHRTSATRER